VKARSEKGGAVQIRLNKVDGPILGEIKISDSTVWSTFEAKVSNLPKGVENLVVVSNDANLVEVDWVRFE